MHMYTTSEMLEALRGNGYAKHVCAALGLCSGHVSQLRRGLEPTLAMARKIAKYTGAEIRDRDGRITYVVEEPVRQIAAQAAAESIPSAEI